jgi:hypothetical protein
MHGKRLSTLACLSFGLSIGCTGIIGSGDSSASPDDGGVLFDATGPGTDGTGSGEAGTCVPKSCQSQGFDCGPAGDGCGGALECGTCNAPETCGGGGQPSVCGGGCTPKTCAELGTNCGPVADGCGGLLQCGTCPNGQTCGAAGKSSVCGAADGGACVKKTCAGLGYNCGPAGDGCGGQINCGTCTAPQTCGGGGKPSVCGGGCTPKTCAELGFNCGPAGDGCGGMLSCGTCTSPQTCGGGGQPSVCGGGGGADAGKDAGRDSASDGSVPSSGDVVQHHKNPSRDGVYVDGSFTSAIAGSLFLDTTFAGAVTGAVYAQPLYVANGPGGQEAFIVATEQNHVTAISGTGSGLWDKTFDTPVTGGLPCGNILPLGITGTPYVDTSSRTIYFDAMTDSGGPAHMVYAISLDDGSTRSGWPVNINAKVTGFDSSHQNERGALALLNGILYVPYGGLAGDCDPYNGWVVAIPVSNPGAPTWYKTAAARGGIWAAGSLPSDGTSIFAVTGNTEGASTWGGGEAILRLGAGATFSGASADYFAPSNWQSLDSSDLDLGGANDFLLDMPGAPVSHLVVAPGKDQNLYLLNRTSLGGIGAQLSKTHVSTDEMNAAGAAYHTSQGTYVALRVANGGHGLNCPVGGQGNLAVAKITAANPPTASVAWCSDEANLGSPIVTTTDGTSQVIVWSANNRLYGYDGDTGAKVFAGGGTNDGMSNTIQYFNTPIETNSRIAVATSGRLYLFR